MIDLRIYKEDIKTSQGLRISTLTEIGHTKDIEIAEEIEGQHNPIKEEYGTRFDILGSHLIPYLAELNIDGRDVNVDRIYKARYYY